MQGFPAICIIHCPSIPFAIILNLGPLIDGTTVLMAFLLSFLTYHNSRHRVQIESPNSPELILLCDISVYYFGCWCHRFTLPGHQQPWHWLCRENRCLFSTRKGFYFLGSLSLENWVKMQIYPDASSNKSITNEVQAPISRTPFLSLIQIRWKYHSALI